MNTKLFSIVIAVTIGAAGCSLNVGTGSNTANSPGNTAPSSPSSFPANTSPASTNPTKSPEVAKPATTASNDPRSENEQIQFAKGTTETTLDRTIAPSVNKMYLFTAKKGQYIYLEATEETGKLEVDFNKQRIKLSDNFQYQLNASGEWAIYVNNPTQNPLKYILLVGID